MNGDSGRRLTNRGDRSIHRYILQASLVLLALAILVMYYSIHNLCHQVRESHL